MGHIINIGYGGTTAIARSSAYNAYIANIRAYKQLTQEEEIKLLQEYISSKNEKRKIEIRNALLNANQCFIVAAAKQYSNNSTELFLDLVSEANMGFIEAIESYDFNKTKEGKIKLISWAAYYIRRACNLYLINNGSMVKQSNTNITYHKLTNARNILTQRFGREPTEEELVEHLSNERKVPIKDVRDVRRTVVSTIDVEVNDEDSLNPIVLDFNELTSTFNDCEVSVEENYNSTMIKMAMSCLSEKERTIIKMIYGFNELGIESSLDSIAEKFNYSSERVRQLHNNALKKMASKVKRVGVNV